MATYRYAEDSLIKHDAMGGDGQTIIRIGFDDDSDDYSGHRYGDSTTVLQVVDVEEVEAEEYPTRCDAESLINMGEIASESVIVARSCNDQEEIPEAQLKNSVIGDPTATATRTRSPPKLPSTPEGNNREETDHNRDRQDKPQPNQNTPQPAQNYSQPSAFHSQSESENLDAKKKKKKGFFGNFKKLMKRSGTKK